MSKNAEKFVEKMNKDHNFSKKVAELYKAGKHKEIEKLAEASGVACSYEELLKTFKAHGLHGGKPLSDQQLEMLVAGARKEDLYSEHSP